MRILLPQRLFCFRRCCATHAILTKANIDVRIGTLASIWIGFGIIWIGIDDRICVGIRWWLWRMNVGIIILVIVCISVNGMLLIIGIMTTVAVGVRIRCRLCMWQVAIMWTIKIRLWSFWWIRIASALLWFSVTVLMSVAYKDTKTYKRMWMSENEWDWFSVAQLTNSIASVIPWDSLLLSSLVLWLWL